MNHDSFSTPQPIRALTLAERREGELVSLFDLLGSAGGDEADLLEFGARKAAELTESSAGAVCLFSGGEVVIARGEWQESFAAPEVAQLLAGISWPDVAVNEEPLIINSDLSRVVVTFREENFVKFGVMVAGRVGGYAPEDARWLGVWAKAVFKLLKSKQQAQQADMLQTVLQSSPVGVMLTDPEGRIEWVNQMFQSMTGYSPGEICGERSDRLRPGGAGMANYDAMWNTTRCGDVWSGELKVALKNGQELYTSTFVAPVFDARGMIQRFVYLQQDSSSQKQLEHQLEQSRRFRLVGLAVADLIHNLRNVITPLSAGVDLLADQDLNSMGRATVESMMQARSRVHSILTQALHFARGHAGERTPISPRVMMDECLQFWRCSVPTTITFETFFNSADLIFAAQGDLELALTNLIRNARQAMPNGGKMRIEVSNATLTRRDQSRFVCFSVADTGVGIDPANIDRILAGHFTTKSDGTGLGLLQVNKVATEHGGFLAVDSEEGAGSVFRLYIPSVDTALGLKPSESKHETALTRSSVSGRLLFADDDEQIRSMTVPLLAAAGYEVTPATNGREAMALFEANGHSFDAVVLDLVMPEGTGLDCVRRIRETHPDMPIVIMTGSVSRNGSGVFDDEMIWLRELEDNGIRMIVPKPFSCRELLTGIQRVLNERQ